MRFGSFARRAGTAPMQPTPATEGLKSLLIQPEVKLDLAAAALQIASEEYPGLDLASYLVRLDRLAERAAGQLSLSVEPDVIDSLDSINRTLYREEGFCGNADVYYDPRNSFLNEVLDRRRGIPITLSIVYMEVGRRLGLNIRGVGLPGHFLVKCLAASGEWLIDPFFGGKTVTEAECRQRLKRLHGEEFPFQRSFLDCVTKRQILGRLLANLKMIYLVQKDFGRALNVIDKILLIFPQAAGEIRDRGSVSFRLQRFSAAIRDWNRYLAMKPQASDVQEVKQNLKVAATQIGLRN